MPIDPKTTPDGPAAFDPDQTPSAPDDGSAPDIAGPAEESEGEASAPVDAGRQVGVDEARMLTRARARDLRALLSTYVKRHLPPREPRKQAVYEPPRQTGAHARLLPVLRTIPWLLGALFALSFLWDFDGMAVSAFGYNRAAEGLLRILTVSGLIGFFTNWLAITMLFNPRNRRPLFGQGLIPAQRERVIYRLAKAVSDELINEEIIKAKIEEAQVIPKYREMALSVTRGVLEDPEFRSDLKALTADYVETVLTSDEVRRRIVDFMIEKFEEHAGAGVGGLALKAYRYLNEEDLKRRIDKAVHAIPGSLDIVLDEMDALLDRIPEKIEARAEEIEQAATRVVLGFVEQLDVYGMIMSNMSEYDERQLEDLLKRTTNEQLNYIKYLGGVLGCVGGLVIWSPLASILTLGVVGGVLYGIDELLYRTRPA